MSILAEIAGYKRQALAAAQAAWPPAEVERAALAAAPPRPFRAALAAGDPAGGPAIIAEIKRRSPVKGTLWEGGDVGARAAEYVAAGAMALSVLTDEPYFGGSVDDLRAVRAAVTVPLLRKDFLVDPYDVLVARACEADCVLLIAAILYPAELQELLNTARDLQMEALVEIHTAAELDTAITAGATLIGINNRDLHTFTTDLGTTERLAPLAPSGTFVVSLSGIGTASEVRRMGAAGAGAVLIGEALVTAFDSTARLLELRGLGPKVEYGRG